MQSIPLYIYICVSQLSNLMPVIHNSLTFFLILVFQLHFQVPKHTTTLQIDQGSLPLSVSYRWPAVPVLAIMNSETMLQTLGLSVPSTSHWRYPFPFPVTGASARTSSSLSFVRTVKCCSLTSSTPSLGKINFEKLRFFIYFLSFFIYIQLNFIIAKKMNKKFVKAIAW